MHTLIINPVVAEPITIVECRSHLNIYAYDTDSDGIASHPDDTMILAMLSASRELCEEFTGLAFAQATYEIAMDEFPDDEVIRPPVAPLVSVTQITTGNTSDDLVDSSVYSVDTYSMPGRIVPVNQWPSVVASTNLVKVRFVAGYGEDSDCARTLPFMARAAILVTLAEMYANRENLGALPRAAEALLRPLRVRTGFA